MAHTSGGGLIDRGNTEAQRRPWWTTNRAGDAATVASGILFLLVCMMLPLVGPAAARGSGSPGATTAAHFEANRTAFTTLLAITTLLAMASVAIKFSARRIDGGGWPRAAVSLVGICLALAIVYAMGWLAI